MNDEQRRRLLGKIRRPGSTIGESIPDEVALQGTTVDVKALVFECDDLAVVPPSKRDEIEDVKTALRRGRLERKQRIAEGDISYEDGERLVEELHGLDRAINALEELDEPDLGEKLRRKKLDDARELLSLVRQMP